MEDEVHYNCKQLLDLLSIYEGELQAREAFIETLQQRQQDTSLQQAMSSSTILYQQQDPFNSLLRDSKQIDNSLNCASCGNRILQTAKILQIQRECDQKINKAINLMKKRYAKMNQEASNERIKDAENCYIKSLEMERDECHNQLKRQQNEFDELQEKKTEIEDKFAENDEKTKKIILYLLEERKEVFEYLNELQKQITNTSPSSVVNSSSSPDGSQIQFNALKEENNRLKNQLYSMQMEKNSLQKRLDYLLKDLQQSAFHQHFQFLQSKGPTDKEMIIIGNGLISQSASEHFQGPNRIRNSSSFPQSFSNDPSNRSSSSSHIDGNDGGGRSRMPHQFPTNHFEQRHTAMQNNAIGPMAGPIPLMASNSTMIMRRLPPSVPRTSAQSMPSSSSNQQHPRVGNSQREAIMNTTNIQLGQPQTVITRRSTSLPRRIVSSAISPSSKQHSLQQMSRKEPLAEHFFYHQQGGRGIIASMDDGNHQKQ